jgi:hypothetical protein
MMEYDSNLPQEFSHLPKRHGASALIIVIAVAVVFLFSALLARPRDEAPTTGAAAHQPQMSSNTVTPSGQ